MNKVYDLIKTHQLKPGDAVELMCPVAGFPKHYAVYIGIRDTPEFIANLMGGVKLVKDEELNGFVEKYQVTNIERFTGTETKRRMIVKKAFSRLGERAYCFVFNNCEHFKNWVLYGESKSLQVSKISAGVAVGGLGLMMMGNIANNKNLQKAGLIILVVLLLAYILFWKIWQDKMESASSF